MADFLGTITDLQGLHLATLRLEHGIRRPLPGASWQAYSPSRFIYAFFTFNSIYSYDWSLSFQVKEIHEWERVTNANGEEVRLTETEQFCQLLNFYYDQLGDYTPPLFACSLQATFDLFGVTDPGEALKGINIAYEDEQLKGLRKKFPNNLKLISLASTDFATHKNALRRALLFIYSVRCNIFHGRKTALEMDEPGQQSRLLIYSAILIAANSLLFEVAKQAPIGWREGREHWITQDEEDSVVVA